MSGELASQQCCDVMPVRSRSNDCTDGERVLFAL